MKDLNKNNKIVVLIDADNAQYSKLNFILDKLSTYGQIVVKRAYGDWSSENLKNWKGPLNELAIQPIQQFAYTTGKNATDASMIIDAMDLLYTRKFDAFALVSSDSDFTKLASRLRESEMLVYGVGEQKTPIPFRNACDDFIMTENLGDEEKPAAPAKIDLVAAREHKIIYLLRLGWQTYQDDEGWANVAPVGNFLKRSQPDFDPRVYGATKITEIIARLDQDFQIKREQGRNGVGLVAFRPVKNGARG